ncbi:hypothetical protein [Prevotella sp. KH2C16]|uniref:hypothetical protein n=1 Tax=Prevotella sp. KH2C16 TaxID=1855325 RepID=UPI001160AF1A|nr:hypothetical protein [Prevotella sp. KH2C16]
MKNSIRLIAIAFTMLCGTTAMADKRDGMATIIMKDGSKLENVQVKVPKYWNDKKFEIKDGAKRTIKSEDVKRMFVWNAADPEHVVEMAYTKCGFYTKKGTDFISSQYWIILVDKGPNVSHWVSGNIEFTKNGCDIVYSSLENSNYFWKDTDEYPMLIEFNGNGGKKTPEQLGGVYLSDDPTLTEALKVDKGKAFKIASSRKFYIVNPFTNKDKVSNTNLWDYDKIVEAYSSKK